MLYMHMICGCTLIVSSALCIPATEIWRYSPYCYSLLLPVHEAKGYIFATCAKRRSLKKDNYRSPLYRL